MALASAVAQCYICPCCLKRWTQQEIQDRLFLYGDPATRPTRPVVSAEELAKLAGSSSGLVLSSRQAGRVHAFEQSLMASLMGAPAVYPSSTDPAWTMLSNDEPSGAPPSIPEDSVPVLNGSVIGYRAWKFNSDWLLAGTGYGVHLPWVPGINVAHCPYGHHAPAENCHCGFNALARFRNDDAWWDIAIGLGSGNIAGAIEARSDDAAHPEEGVGSLVVDPPGFRARYAKIILLAINPNWPRPLQMAVRGAATDHGADVCQIEHLADAAAEHGQLIPDELLEWARPTKTINTPNMTEQLKNIAAACNMVTATGTTAAGAMARLQEMFKIQQHSVSITKPKSRKPKGVKAILRTVGPPTLGSWKTGDRVRDRKRQIWICESGGKPGTWALEETSYAGIKVLVDPAADPGTTMSMVHADPQTGKPRIYQVFQTDLGPNQRRLPPIN